MGSQLSSQSSSRSSSRSDRSDRKAKYDHRSDHYTSSPPPYTAPPYPPNNPEHSSMTIHPPEFTHQPMHPIPHGGMPPQGRRFQTSTSAPFPGIDITGPPPFRDVGGEPVFVGSSISPGSVHPCKLVPHLRPVCRVAYGGGELEHEGRYDLLPITHEHEWVPTSNGRIPEGRRPVDGGYEESGHRLYHAVAVVHGCSVPGKTGEHLGAANVPFGGSEIVVAEGYWILCWRE